MIKRLERDIGHAYVTKFLWYDKDIVICTLSNGNFLGWDLNNNQFEEHSGHPGNAKITSVAKYGSKVVSADEVGCVQIRDNEWQFQKF